MEESLNPPRFIDHLTESSGEVSTVNDLKARIDFFEKRHKIVYSNLILLNIQDLDKITYDISWKNGQLRLQKTASNQEGFNVEGLIAQRVADVLRYQNSLVKGFYQGVESRYKQKNTFPIYSSLLDKGFDCFTSFLDSCCYGSVSRLLKEEISADHNFDADSSFLDNLELIDKLSPEDFPVVVSYSNKNGIVGHVELVLGVDPEDKKGVTFCQPGNNRVFCLNVVRRYKNSSGDYPIINYYKAGIA